MKRNHLYALFPLFAALLVALPASHPAGAGPLAPGDVGGCPLFPANNIWNARVDRLPLDPHSADYINSIGATRGLHPDFGANWNGGPFGIPYTTVPGAQAQVPVSFEYADESDPGPYPIPPDAPIEGGADSDGDRHVIVVDRDNCKLYEMWNSWPQTGGSWYAGSGAVFDLRSNLLRPDTWTSADAAGLPILPGLVRYDEVASGEIRHAIRFTAQITQRSYVWPARHYASSNTSPSVPPMGQRFRLKSSVDISGFEPPVQVIFTAFKRYGLILADNGSNWYVSGAPDARWDDDMLVSAFRLLHGSDFEAVDVSGLMIDPNSGQARLLAVNDLRVTSAVTATGTATVTLGWTPMPGASGAALRYSTSPITEANWDAAPVLSGSLAGDAATYTTTVPYTDGTLYFAIKWRDSLSTWSPISNLAFWPSHDVYLPAVLRGG